MNEDLLAEIASLEARLRPLQRGASLAWWGMSTEGGQAYQEVAQVLGEAAKGLFADKERFSRLEAWHARREEISDPETRRILEHLYQGALAGQSTPEEISRLLALEIGLEADYTAHRGVVQGEEKSDNDLKEILETSTDNRLRQEAWEASKQVGEKVVERVLEVVRLRNQTAQRLGRRDHYALALETQEVDEGFLFDLLDSLDDLTRAPFLAHKAADDAKRAERFGVAVGDLRPWHYDDPFYQSVAPDAQMTAPWFAGLEEKGLERLCEETFASCGLCVAPIIAKADLYERPKKNQHAFCMMADADTKDIRILCNLRPTLAWAGTILHEFGHGIYDAQLGEGLPWFLKSAAHINSTEAIAMIFGRQVNRAEWLTGFLGAPEADVAKHRQALADNQNYAMLLFSRWMQVMVRFERALYENPDREDLNTLWWDLVERYQGLTRPEGRDKPDWAAKMHLANAPVYYHNYMIGEMTASQIEHAILAKTGKGLLHNPAAGDLLRGMFASGSTHRWDDLVEMVTGAPLSPDAWAADFAKPPG